MTWQDVIERELENCRVALIQGNDGRSRACARRAAGKAIAVFNEMFPDQAVTGSTAIERLRSLARSLGFPEPVCQAALRLTTNVNQRLSVKFTMNPLLDARILVDCISERIKEKAS